MQVRAGESTWVTEALGMPQLGRGWGEGEARMEQGHPTTCRCELLCSFQLIVRDTVLCVTLATSLTPQRTAVCAGPDGSGVARCGGEFQAGHASSHRHDPDNLTSANVRAMTREQIFRDSCSEGVTCKWRPRS